MIPPRLLLPLLAALLGCTASVSEAAPRRDNALQRARETQQQRAEQRQEYRDSLRPRIVLVPSSPNVIIGTIVRVNEEEGFAVGWLQSRYLNLNGTIITRDDRLRTTAQLSVGSARNNRAVSLNINSGTPRVGDEIVLSAIVPPLLNTADAQGAQHPTAPEGTAFGTAAQPPASPQSAVTVAAPQPPAPPRPPQSSGPGQGQPEARRTVTVTIK